jgi:hypothetical protein
MERSEALCLSSMGQAPLTLGEVVGQDPLPAAGAELPDAAATSLVQVEALPPVAEQDAPPEQGAAASLAQAGAQPASPKPTRSSHRTSSLHYCPFHTSDRTARLIQEVALVLQAVAERDAQPARAAASRAQAGGQSVPPKQGHSPHRISSLRYYPFHTSDRSGRPSEQVAPLLQAVAGRDAQPAQPAASPAQAAVQRASPRPNRSLHRTSSFRYSLSHTSDMCGLLVQEAGPR